MLNEIKNSIDFFIRNNTKFSRKNFVEKNPDLCKTDGIFKKRVQARFTEIFPQYVRSPPAVRSVPCRELSTAS